MGEESVSSRLAMLEERQQRYADREWVRDFVQPVKDGVLEIKASMTTLAEKQTETAEAQKQLFAAHDALLKQQAEGEKTKREQGTLFNQLKKWAAIAAAIIAIVTAFRLLGTYAEVYIKSVASHEPQQTQGTNSR
jgi:hypothetical protein